MASVLHGSARTTPRVRAELQEAQASSRALARQCGVNPETILKWRNRTTTADAAMGPPKPRTTMLTEAARNQLAPPHSGTIRRGAVSDIVLGVVRALTELERQSRLRAIERLNLALLVERQHDRVALRRHSEPHHVVKLDGEMRIGRASEGAHVVRLEVVRPQNPLHRGQRQPA